MTEQDRQIRVLPALVPCPGGWHLGGSVPRPEAACPLLLRHWAGGDTGPHLGYPQNPSRKWNPGGMGSGVCVLSPDRGLRPTEANWPAPWPSPSLAFQNQLLSAPWGECRPIRSPSKDSPNNSQESLLSPLQGPLPICLSQGGVASRSVRERTGASGPPSTISTNSRGPVGE